MLGFVKQACNPSVLYSNMSWYTEMRVNVVYDLLKRLSSAYHEIDLLWLSRTVTLPNKGSDYQTSKKLTAENKITSAKEQTQWRRVIQRITQCATPFNHDL